LNSARVLLLLLLSQLGTEISLYDVRDYESTMENRASSTCVHVYTVAGRYGKIPITHYQTHIVVTFSECTHNNTLLYTRTVCYVPENDFCTDFVRRMKPPTAYTDFLWKKLHTDPTLNSAQCCRPWRSQSRASAERAARDVRDVLRAATINLFGGMISLGFRRFRKNNMHLAYSTGIQHWH